MGLWHNIESGGGAPQGTLATGAQNRDRGEVSSGNAASASAEAESLARERRVFRMRNLPKIETVEQAREVLLGMGEEQEITAELDEWKASIKKHNDLEYNVSFVDLETGIISLRDASYILLEHGDHDLYLG